MDDSNVLDYSVADSIDIEDSLLISKLNDIITNIELLIPEYLNNAHVETVNELSQQQYNGLLMYINMQYIRPTKCLYKYIQGVSNNGRCVLMYDDDLLYLLCEYYIYITMQYGKVVNPHGFSLLVGCDTDQFTRWEKLEGQRPRVCGMVKRLRKEYESSLENGAQSGKNPVGFIATLNHRFGWSSEGKTTLTVNITRNKDEIMSSVNPELITDKS